MSKNIYEIRQCDYCGEEYQTDAYIKIIYMQGGCYQFYKLLKYLFPQAIAYLVKHDDKSTQFDHIITNIDGKFYDITGEIKLSQYQEHRKLTLEDLNIVENWGFSKRYFLGKVCDSCGEIVIERKNEHKEKKGY